MSDALNIKAGIICDVVRREDNGKLLFVGVYERSILAAKLPANLGVYCVIVAEAKKLGDVDIEFRVLHGENTVAGGEGTVTVHRLGHSLWPIPRTTMKDLKEGKLSFQLREKGEEWQEIVEIEIQLKS